MKNDFYCWDNDKSDVEQVLNCGVQVLEELKKKILELQKKADENTGKIMPVESVSDLIRNPSSIMSFHEGSGWYFKPDYKTAIKLANEYAEEQLKIGKEKHEKNLIAIENNKQVIEKIKLFMSNVGIPSSRRVRDYQTRKRGINYKDETAGYISDCNHIITYDGFDSLERSYKRLKEAIVKFEKEEEQKIREKIQAEEKIKKDESDKMVKAALIVKYGLDYNSSWETIRDTILNKDKYLYLAYYLNENRNDWNDGCDSARHGLSNFPVVTEDDQKIYDEIQGLCDDWDGDGRCFRDCLYNYDYLYEIADKDLYNDLQKIPNN